jgi:hypothetical protein
MMKILIKTVSIIFLAILAHGSIATINDSELSDDQVIDAIIKKSISSYLGDCPCPYSSDKDGNNCDEKSAYTKTKGYSPICFKSDVSKKMIEKYRKNLQSGKTGINKKNSGCGCEDSKTKTSSSKTQKVQTSPKKNQLTK